MTREVFKHKENHNEWVVLDFVITVLGSEVNKTCMLEENALLWRNFAFGQAIVKSIQYGKTLRCARMKNEVCGYIISFCCRWIVVIEYNEIENWESVTYFRLGWEDSAIFIRGWTLALF